MKKIFFLALAVLMLAGIASPAFAEIFVTRAPGSFAKVVVAVFSSGEGRELNSTVTIQNKILGVSYTDSSAGHGAIYDSATNTGASSSNLIAEVFCAAGQVSTIIFPMPVEISNGLVTCPRNSTGVVMVWYE